MPCDHFKAGRAAIHGVKLFVRPELHVSLFFRKAVQ